MLDVPTGLSCRGFLHYKTTHICGKDENFVRVSNFRASAARGWSCICVPSRAVFSLV